MRPYRYDTPAKSPPDPVTDPIPPLGMILGFLWWHQGDSDTGAGGCARPSCFDMFAGKGFGRRPWQPSSSWGNKKSGYQRWTGRPRWLVATQPHRPPLQANNMRGLSWGLGEKALTGIIRAVYLSALGNPLLLIDSLMGFFFFGKWRCLHWIDGAVWFLDAISSQKDEFVGVYLCTGMYLLW